MPSVLDWILFLSWIGVMYIYVKWVLEEVNKEE